MISLEIRRFLVAAGYFTRLPVPAWVGWSSSELNRAARYFPLVGALVGLVSAGAMGLTTLVLPAALAVCIGMAASILLTGAFHEDGLADSADGFGGGYEPAQVLRIMKDSRIGSFGSIALILVLLTKFLALSALLDQSLATAAAVLVMAHAASRAAALGVMALLPYVRDGETSRAKPVAEGIGTREWLTGAALGLLPMALAVAAALVPWSSALVALGLALITIMLCARYFRRRLGGYTGDCLGATQQLCELVIYLAFCARLA